MNLIWSVVLFAAAGWGSVLLFLFALCKVTGDEDRIAGKTEGTLIGV